MTYPLPAPDPVPEGDPDGNGSHGEGPIELLLWLAAIGSVLFALSLLCGEAQ